MFRVGDAVVHPVRGAGVVISIEERQQGDVSNTYYRIEMLRQPVIRLMLPVSVAEAVGLRHAVPPARLKEVWDVLLGEPQRLPGDKDVRYQSLKDKLRSGSIFQVAEAVRDMAWRQRGERGLTTVGKRLYEEGLELLAAEIAAAQGGCVADVEAQVKGKLKESLADSAPT